jgi:hypothetical protein
MSYRVVADPTLVDPCVPIQGTIAFSNALGDPPVSTVVTVSGSTRTPTTVDAPLTVRCPGTLEISRCEGDTENVYLEWELGGTPGWDFLFLYRDGTLLATLASDATSYTDEDLEPGDYVYTLVTFVVDDPAEPQLVFTYCTGTVIPVTITSIEPSMGYWIGGDTVTVRGTAFTSAETTTLSFFDGEQTLPLQVTEIVSPEELRAVTPESPRLGRYGLRIQNERGSAELPDSFEYGFVRAEANADGKVDISDGIFILDFFYLGNAVPRCMDAVDTTDDGIHDISDAIRIFSFLFLGGAPPPAPFAGPGRDTTPDAFGCLEEPQA